LTQDLIWYQASVESQEYRHFNTSVCLINYHSIWIPKQRKAVLTGPIERDLRRILEKKAEELHCLIIALEIMPDHVHLFLNSPPVMAPDQIMFRLKGHSSRVLRGSIPDLDATAFSLDSLLFLLNRRKRFQHNNRMLYCRTESFLAIHPTTKAGGFLGLFL
jgi:putative transposase